MLHIFFLNISDEKLVPSNIYIFIKGLISVNLSRVLPTLSRFNTTVAAYWKHFYLFLLVGFIVASLYFVQSRESIYDPAHSNLFCDIYNTMNKDNWRQIYF